jgi:hypothetical protein
MVLHPLTNNSRVAYIGEKFKNENPIAAIIAEAIPLSPPLQDSFGGFPEMGMNVILAEVPFPSLGGVED